MKKTILSVATALTIMLPVAAFAAPVITLNGGSVSVQQGNSYNEPGYSATDSIDGNLTSSVVIGGSVLTFSAGLYTLSYDVSNSVGEAADTQHREVMVNGGGGGADPCTYNHSCPCPISYSAQPQAWTSCVVANYPKTDNGDTLVCRLKALQPLEGTTPTCADDQAGFLNTLARKSPLWGFFVIHTLVCCVWTYGKVLYWEKCIETPLL